MCRKVCSCIGEIVVLVWWMSIGSHAAIVGIWRSWVGSGIHRDVSSYSLCPKKAMYRLVEKRNVHNNLSLLPLIPLKKYCVA